MHDQRRESRMARGVSRPAAPIEERPPLPTTSAPTACPRSGTVSLSDGLLVAQGAISGVSKDSRNTFHRYAYTSAEGMISACRDALQKGGVVARRTGWEIVADGLYVQSRLTVCHGWTGESAESVVVWPIVVEKGRPVDKAVASALTTSLSYWLRDLLCLPREDESGHMDGRNDDRNETRHGVRDRVAPATSEPTDGPKRAPRSTGAAAVNSALAGNAPTMPATASDAPNPPTAAPDAGNAATDEPTAIAAAVLHRLETRNVGNRSYRVAGFLSDGNLTEYVVGGTIAIATWLPELVGQTLIPVVVSRGSKMPMLVDVRTVAPTTERGADDELPF